LKNWAKAIRPAAERISNPPGSRLSGIKYCYGYFGGRINHGQVEGCPYILAGANLATIYSLVMLKQYG